MVIIGATQPDAHAAAVTSEVIRHGKFFVFHSCSRKGMMEGGLLCDRGTMTLGEAANWDFSLIASSRPLRGILRVIICSLVGIAETDPSQGERIDVLTVSQKSNMT